MIRLKREHYAVGEVEHPNGVTVTVGLSYNPAMVDDIEELSYTAQRFAREALAQHGGNHALLELAVEEMVDKALHGRPFYVETREGGRGVQVYQPYGMPLDVKPCEEHGYNCPDLPGCHVPQNERRGRVPDHES